MSALLERLDGVVAQIRERSGLQPDVGIVLGSGLGSFADGLDDAVAIPYRELPGFPTATVQGHPGRLVVGKIGRAHV